MAIKIKGKDTVFINIGWFEFSIEDAAKSLSAYLDDANQQEREYILNSLSPLIDKIMEMYKGGLI